MRFDDFPMEIKTKIMSYISTNMLCSRVALVSKQWSSLAHNRVLWKELNFNGYLCSCHKSIGHILCCTRPSKLNFYHYQVSKKHVTVWPVSKSVNELNFDGCYFPSQNRCVYPPCKNPCLDNNVVKLLVKTFPNVSKLRIKLFSLEDGYDSDEGYCNSGGLTNGVQFFSGWKNLSSLELNYIHDFDYNGFVKDIAEQDHRLEELILLKSGVLNNSTLQCVVNSQGPYLKRFTMYFNRITSYGYRGLWLCQNLTHLSLLWPRNLTDIELLMIVEKLPILVYLRIENTRKLFSKKFTKIFKKVKTLKIVELVINNCAKFDDEALRSIINCSPSLKNMSLQNLNKISDKGLRLLIKGDSKLESLKLTKIDYVSKKCLKKIVRDLPNICEVISRDCKMIIDSKDRNLVLKP